MNSFRGKAFSRRDLVRAGSLAAAGLIAAPALSQINGGLSGFVRPTATAMSASPLTIRPDLFRRALAALQRHGSRIPRHDRIGLVDFDLPSSQPRFHLVDLDSGRSRSMLVAHGRGSDPEHTGWLTRFSNEMGSQASSEGACLTGDTYVGQHGHSRRLIGLDPSNSNIEPRAIVVHSAWYVGPQMVAQHGKLGRSEGCFALSASDLEDVLSYLGEGRMIYADKV